ncbi:PRC-barrel domain-containing protein [Sphingomonas sp.]|uniref:PRC-barrel domain-containing protein n=1 Tax=Sphingomonas sp. TaxID=28214 RepID=UPI0025D1E675|nr:PRC-barrel domain-containing protein [Sphingomonas sp.]
MNQVAAWLAPAATIIAAVMTAANLGARVTGWGFIVFTIGSVCWSLVAIGTGQQNLLLTNGFLTLVNGLGIWRWLGRQSRYEEGGADAARRSAVAPVPTLIALGSIAGRKLVDENGEALGTIIDGMMRCSDRSLAYVVVSEGGVGGVGERLHALDPAYLTFRDDRITCTLDATALAALPVIPAGKWPKAIATATENLPEISDVPATYRS